MEINGAKLNAKDVHHTLDWLMKRQLDLGQSSLSEHQFKAYRKMTMDVFAEAKRDLARPGKGRCGAECKDEAKGVVNMDG